MSHDYGPEPDTVTVRMDDSEARYTPTLLERAWLHHCGRLVAGTNEEFCPGCRTDLKRPSEVEARYVLVPVQGPPTGG